MAFARGASHHQKLHGKESREGAVALCRPSGAIPEPPSTDILPDKKERLNGANFTRGIFQDEILIAEVRFERLRDDFVKAVILALTAERRFPRVDVANEIGTELALSRLTTDGAGLHEGSRRGSRFAPHISQFCGVSQASGAETSHSVATFFFVCVNVFGLEHAAADMQVALREGNLDAGFAEFLLDREVQIALETAGPVAHFAAPDDQLESRSRFRQNCSGKRSAPDRATTCGLLRPAAINASRTLLRRSRRRRRPGCETAPADRRRSSSSRASR